MFVGERCSGCGCRLEKFRISNVSNLVIDEIVSTTNRDERLFSH
jgi:predicted  nucleic acid-binding Zn-ribbon protein